MVFDRHNFSSNLGANFQMKKANGVKSSWKQVDDKLHELKGALTMINCSINQLKKACIKIGTCIEIIYEEIEGLKDE